MLVVGLEGLGLMHVAAIVVQTILLLGQAPPPSEPPPTGLILGRVVDGTTNRPVAGAIVAIDNVAMVVPGAPPRPTTPIRSAPANAGSAP